MRRPLVKICGITNIDDAISCLNAGADILGFIFYPKSPRYVLPQIVKNIVEGLKRDYVFCTVGVFVNPEKDLVNRIIEVTGIEYLQFHGNESPSFIQKFSKKVIKAFRIKDKSDISYCYEYKNIDYFLLDSYSKESLGGTGHTFDWDLLEAFQYKDRLFLSGGINSLNVIEAIKKVKPYAIDLSSSIEVSPGKKDKKKIDYFFSILDNLT
ncbi:MAG: phosphoribosylanthranilate isomerase [Spirochaetota bacterium]|nr:phosphoribosylanthranilate isomerase [Spirochaetota bacterium]